MPADKTPDAPKKERRAAPRPPSDDKAPARRRARPADAAELPPADTAAAAPISSEEMHRRIELAAYLRAERRGFAPGYELEDWLAAEQEVRAGLQRQ